MQIEIPNQKSVISYFGITNQNLQCCEELAELIFAISKMNRAVIRGSDLEVARFNILEECADSIISIEQLKTMYGITDAEIQRMVDRKCRRIRKRMESGVKA